MEKAPGEPFDVPGGPVVGTPFANPGALGLAGFALTTFLLSAANAGWMHAATGSAWLGYAFAYGGGAQIIAGIFEFCNKSVFGATAFTSYGAFWIGLGLWVELVEPNHPHAAAATDLAWILLAWAIFNSYLLLWATAVDTTVFVIFFLLEVTLIILAVGGFTGNSAITQIGGYVGVLLALAAWYGSAAVVINEITGRSVLPLGKPFGPLALDVRRA